MFEVLLIFFWVIPRRPNFVSLRFGTLCLFHLHRQVGVDTYLPMKMEQNVPKRRYIKFRLREITQKKTYNIQNTAKVWNQKCSKCPPPVSRHLLTRRTVFSKTVFSIARSTFRMYSVMAIFISLICGDCNRQVHRDFLITLYNTSVGRE
jgi:hypothetical protein